MQRYTGSCLPGVLRIRAGLFNEPLEARPVFHAYTGSKANWWSILDDLPCYEGMADPAGKR